MKTVFLFVIGLQMAFTGSACGQNGLHGIQQTIGQAFYASLAGGNSSELNRITALLENDGSAAATYWLAYAKYYEAVFFLKTGDKEKSKAAIDEGIEALSKVKNKNSEDYALLVIMQNFSMQFISNMAAMGVTSGKIGDHVEKALKTGANNLRAYYAAAAADFYMPEQYGGGTKAEGYLLKAVALGEQPVVDDSLPSWGKDQAYLMLVALYLKRNDRDLAKKYLEEAMQLYPDNYGLKELAKKVNE